MKEDIYIILLLLPQEGAAIGDKMLMIIIFLKLLLKFSHHIRLLFGLNVYNTRIGPLVILFPVDQKRLLFFID